MLVVLLGGMFFYTPVVKAETSRDQLLAQIQQLLKLITALQEQVSQMKNSDTDSSTASESASKNISVGSRVKTTDTLRVRSGASANANWINNVAAFTGGVVVAGPKYSDGYTWWHVTYDSGTSGWSVENWLKPITSTVTEKENIIDEDDDTPSCKVKTNKSSYSLHDDIKVSWTSENVNYLTLIDSDPFKDGLVTSSESDKLDVSGSLTLEATVLGSPDITLKAVAADGTTVQCATVVEVTETTETFEAVLNDEEIKEVEDVSKAEAEEMCKVLYNDYETYNFGYGDVLECLWDGDEFETINQWKG